MLRQFYEKLLPTQGVYCISGIDRNKRIVNRFAESIDDLCETVDDLARSEQNIFVAPGSFAGHSRRADSAVFMKSFFIDLDVGADKDYASKDEALEAIDFLLKETGLPEPVRVDSGGGVHAYWIFDEEVPIAVWKPYADKFKARVLENIPIDPVVTADAARIMRAPYTVNYKYAPAVRTEVLSSEVHVYPFGAFKEFLGDVSLSPFAVLAAVPKGLDDDTLKMLKHDNFDKQFSIIANKSLEGEGCAQIRHILINSATLPEPLWHSGLSIARQCSDWEEAIQLMSEDYPKYDRELTIKKANETYNKPHSCAKFEERNPGGCDGCPHRGKITNPLALGRVFREAPTATEEDAVRQEQDSEDIPAFPAYLKPYIRGANGGIYVVGDEDDVDSKPVLITRQDVWPVKRMYNPMDGECLLMRVQLPKDPVREFTLPMKAVYSLDKFKEIMSSYGIRFIPAHAPYLTGYIIRWSEYLMNISAAEQMRMQMGWTEDSTGFVVGHSEVRNDGTIIKTAPSPMISVVARMLKPVGDYDKWKEAANKLNWPEFEMHAFGLFIGFGSPLMKFTSTSGAAICYTGKSANAKTGALYAALSVYGNPKELSLAGEKSATENALTGWYLALQNIVFGLDEASNKEPKHLSDLIHRMSQGKAKLRMQSNVNAVRELEQMASLIMFMTSNQSMYDKLTSLKASPDGEVARLIEFIIHRPSILDGPRGTEIGREIFDTFRTNYGHAVFDYAKYLFEIGEAEIKATIEKWSKKFVAEFGEDVSYRFYQNVISVSMAGGELAVRAGIVNIDLERVFTKVIAEVIAIREKTIRVNKVDYGALIGEYMNRNQMGVLVVNEGRVTREPRGPLVARIDVSSGMYYVSKTEFRKHLVEQQVSTREFEYATEKEGTLTYLGKQRLSNGWSGTTSTPIAVYGFKVEIPDEWRVE